MSSLNFNEIFSIKGQKDFDQYALALFKYQASQNRVYAKYLALLDINPADVKEITQIPFLPIDFFKKHRLITGEWSPDNVFYSSGTTGERRSAHYQKSIQAYLSLAQWIFESNYGELNSYVVIGLLPSYMENGGSSLVCMVDHFIKLSDHSSSGFYMDLPSKSLHKIIKSAKQDNRKILLIGVSYALLDLAEEGCDLSDAIVMETGGMKGRRKELIRTELHARLQKGFNVDLVHSEYGMTELMSQFYSHGKGVFKQGMSARVLIRQTDDPFAYAKPGSVGGVNVIDLGNAHSCAFIETQDLGKKLSDTEFEVLGRFDNSDVRGCNLLYTI